LPTPPGAHAAPQNCCYPYFTSNGYTGDIPSTTTDRLQRVVSASTPRASQSRVTRSPARGWQSPSPSTCRKAALFASTARGCLTQIWQSETRCLRGFDESSGLIVCQGRADDSNIMLGGESDEHIPAHIVLTSGG